MGLGNAIELVYSAQRSLPWQLSVKWNVCENLPCVCSAVFATPRFSNRSIVEHNGRLDGRFVSDALKRLAVLLQFEHLVDDTLCFDLARVKILNRLRCSSR